MRKSVCAEMWVTRRVVSRLSRGRAHGSLVYAGTVCATMCATAPSGCSAGDCSPGSTPPGTRNRTGRPSKDRPRTTGLRYHKRPTCTSTSAVRNGYAMGAGTASRERTPSAHGSGHDATSPRTPQRVPLWQPIVRSRCDREKPLLQQSPFTAPCRPRRPFPSSAAGAAASSAWPSCSSFRRAICLEARAGRVARRP